MKILGIDPGSRITGFGIIERIGSSNQYNYLVSGAIKIKDLSWGEKGREIFQGLTELIEHYKPTIAALEQVFLAKDPRAAIKLGQARGMALAACGCSKLEIYEYAPRKIKQAVVGYGGATKMQIQTMVRTLLNLDNIPKTDSADALAVALCCGFNARYSI